MLRIRDDQPWEPWDYRVLHEENDVEKTARLLGRSVEDVRQKTDLSLDEWYRRRRCAGSPETLAAIRRTQRRVYHRGGFDRYVTVGELEELTRQALAAAFKHFDPSKVPDSVAVRLSPAQTRLLSVQEKFARFFGVCLKSRLRRQEKRRLRQIGRWAPLPDDLADSPRDRGREQERLAWMRLLRDRAISRLPVEAAVVIHLRTDKHFTFGQIATLIFRKEQTLRLRYSGPKITRMIRTEVGRMVAGLADGDRRDLIRYLLEDVGLDMRTAAALLCVAVDDVVKWLRDGTPSIGVRGRDELMNMFRKENRQ